jgi:hypothetical protein
LSLLGYYAASSGNPLPTFRDIVSIPYSSWPLKMGPILCPETALKNYHSTLRNTPAERNVLNIALQPDPVSQMNSL